MSGPIDLAVLFVVIARTGIARAKNAESSVTGISVISTGASFARRSDVTSWTTTRFDLSRSSVSGEVFYRRVETNVADVSRRHFFTVRSSYQNSFDIGKNRHHIRTRSTAWSRRRQSFPLRFSQWNGVGLKRKSNVYSKYLSPSSPPSSFVRTSGMSGKTSVGLVQNNVMPFPTSKMS